MPIYAYECAACQKTHEVIQKFSDLPMKECPDCKGAVTKTMGRGAAFIFKGAGFYTNDYKRAGSAGACESNKGGCGKPECAS